MLTPSENFELTKWAMGILTLPIGWLWKRTSCIHDKVSKLQTDVETIKIHAEYTRKAIDEVKENTTRTREGRPLRPAD